jgi:hypothetical protein
MKVYLVVQDYDYGPGYNIGEIHGAYLSKTKAEEAAKEMDENYKSTMPIDDSDRNYEWFYVYGKEFEMNEDT